MHSDSGKCLLQDGSRGGCLACEVSACSHGTAAAAAAVTVPGAQTATPSQQVCVSRGNMLPVVRRFVLVRPPSSG
jgi:hypothetical protein